MTNELLATPEEPKRRRDARVRWIVIGVVTLALLLVLGGGVGVLSALFESGDLGLSKRVVGAVNAAIGSDSTRFVCDRVHGTLLRGAIVERPRLLVRTARGEFTWAAARRARVDYDLWMLLVSSRRSFTLSLDSLQVVIARDSTGSVIMPRFRKGSGAPSRVETRIHVALRGASLQMVRERIEISGIKGRGNVTVSPNGSSALVDRLEGVASGAGASTPVRVEGMVAFRDSLWRVDPLIVTLPASKVTASAEWNSRRGRAQEGTLRLAPLVLEEVLPILDVEGVAGSLRGDVLFAGALGDGVAEGCLEGTLAGESFDTLLVRAAFQRDGIRVERLESRLRGATVTGVGRIDSRGELDATLQFSKADPASFPWWRAPAGTPHGSLAGEARLRLSRARPRPAVRVAATLRRSHIGRIPIDRATFLVQAPPRGGLLLDSLALDSPGARLTGGGTLGADGALRLSASVTVSDLSRMGTLLAPLAPRGGKGRATASLGGTLDAPTLELRAAIARPRFESGLGADSVVVSAAGPLAPTLDLRGAVRVARLEAKGRALGNVDATFSGGSPLAVDRFVQSMGDTTLTLRGAVSFDRAGVTARVDSLRLVAGALRATATEPARVVFTRGRLHASPLALDLSPGRLEADLDWNVSKGTIDLRGFLEGLELARFSRGEVGAPTGRVRAQFVASGPTEDPEVSIGGTISNPHLGGLAGDSLEARLEYAPGVLTVESLKWRRGASRATLLGSLRTSSTLERLLRRWGARDRGWADGVTATMEATADSFDLALLAPVDTTLKSLEGSAEVRARIGGTVASPILSVVARASRLHYQALEGTVPSAEFAYRDGVLTLEGLEIRQGASVSRVAGFIPVDLAPFARERWRRDEPLRLSVRMNEADFAVLPSLTSLVASSAGKLSGEAEVTGTPRRPKLSGSVRLREGKVRFAGRYEVLEGIAIDGAFDEERLTLTRIEARQGKRGRITGEGVWRWSDLGQALPAGSIGPPGEYEVRLKAADCVATDREYYLFQFSGSFVVANGRTDAGVVKPRITGNAVVSRGELTMNLAAPAGEPPPPLPFLYDINAEFPRQFKYRQLDTEIDLAGTLQLRNEGERDIALGVLTVKGGQFYFLTRKFQDLTGDVNFNSLERFDPDVAIDAKTRVPRVENGGGGEDREIYLAVTGRASQLQIRPWDKSQSTPGELWRYLSVGQFSGAESPDAVQAADPLSGGGLRLPIRDYLFRNAERWIAGSGFIDTIDLRSGSRSGEAAKTFGGPIDLGTVGVGKYVTRDLFLKYSRDFSGQSAAGISAEYRVTRHLLLRGQQIQGRQASTRADQEYNLDLKIRVEY